MFKKLTAALLDFWLGPVDNPPMRSAVQYTPDMMADIVQFHETFGLEYDGPPRSLNRELREFREKFMQEERDEYVRARHDELEKQFDALVDLVYVALGTAYLQGFDFDEAWRRVHAANMQKVRCERLGDSLRGSTFDVIKPPGWVPPSYEGLV